MTTARRAVRLCRRAVVTGVVFWDYFHGQTGVAPNAVELHPILGFRCLGWAHQDDPCSADPSDEPPVGRRVADGLRAMPALRRTALAGELAALNGTLVALLLTNASMAELMAVQDQVRTLLDQLEKEEAAEELGQPSDSRQRPDLRSP
jgi:hypothetical protein